MLQHKLITLILVIGTYSFSFAQEIDSVRLLQHVERLASDNWSGRRPHRDGHLQAQNYVLQELSSLEGVQPLFPEYVQHFNFFHTREQKNYDQVANIVAFVPGKSSKKVIVITAHYDHVGIGRPNSEGDSIYNGADDNASGTAALLELARYFSKNQPQHGMVFAAVDAEEMGLRGAKALVENFPLPLDQILLNVNMDMLSRSDAKEVYASGTYYHPVFKRILETLPTQIHSQLKFGHDIPGTGSEDWTRSSDHGAFFEKKIPHLYFGVEDHEDYHTPRDEFKRIHPQFYLGTVYLILDAIRALDRELLDEE